MLRPIHQPVLLNEVIEYLSLKPGQKIIDATFGSGGHSAALLKEIGPRGKVLGIEIDPEMFRKAEERFPKARGVILVNGSYADLKKIAQEHGFLEADGIIIDAGLSSWHLSGSGRGFTFAKDEPLDMRFNPVESPLTAAEIVNLWPKEQIEEIVRTLGEEKFSRRIAEEIVRARKIKPITSTLGLIEVIKEAVPLKYRSGRIHFATRTFQALRIAVNNELENLESVIAQFPDVLGPGAPAAVITFHSLEDRIVKKAFRDFQKKGIGEIVTKKPIRPSFGEIEENPRARSAKLRVLKLK